jgi:hypothetical protein
MPVGFDNVVADGTIIGFGLFDPMHVLAIGQMVAHKVDDEDLGTILWSFKCLVRDVPIDGAKYVERPVIPGNESLAGSGSANSCLLELFCMSLSNGFDFDRETA